MNLTAGKCQLFCFLNLEIPKTVFFTYSKSCARIPQKSLCCKQSPCAYSEVSNKRGGWYKRGGYYIGLFGHYIKNHVLFNKIF